MKAVVVRTAGGPEVLEYTEVAQPPVGKDDVLIDVAAAGVNFIDIYQREGIYDMPLPYTPGLEGSGTISAVGPDVSDFAPGDRVAWAGGMGSYAEQVVRHPDTLVRVPDAVTDLQAAQLMLQGLTAHYLITSVFDIKPGHTALVHAAAGGVGLLLCQLISQRGGTVIGTVSTEAKEKAARTAGAAHVIRYDQDPVAEQVSALTGGAGVDVVYDGVGKSTFDASLASLRTRGLLALFGQSSGAVEAFDPQVLNQRGSLSLTRPSLAHFVATPEELRWRASEIFGAVAAGTLNLALHDSYALADTAQAHRDLASRATSGKLVLLPQ
jgi:NADPH2:quinone reductase